MEEVNLRFQHISEQIFGCLDNESLANCQEVCKSWNNFLDGQKLLHARIILETVTKYHKVGKSWFQVFNKCNTKTIMDLRIAVEHVYQELGIFATYKEEMDWAVSKEHHNQSELRCVSPLHIAAAFGQLSLFNDILQRVESKFPLDDLCRSTLHYAAINDHLNIFESIVAIDGNILPSSTYNLTIPPTTPLDMAALNNSLKVCRYIVENIQDPYHACMQEWTPLHEAAVRGHIEVYKIYMEKVVDKNPLSGGLTPLHLAATCGHLEMCRLILENVNDKHPVTDHGRTPMDFAKNHPEILKLFIG